MGTSSEAASTIRAAITNGLETEISLARCKVYKLEAARGTLIRDPDALVFEVSLVSLWADDGEKPVTVRSAKGLSFAIKQAQKRFKKINNRSDVQAKYSARAFISRDVRTKSFSIPIDESYISSLV